MTSMNIHDIESVRLPDVCNSESCVSFPRFVFVILNHAFHSRTKQFKYLILLIENALHYKREPNTFQVLLSIDHKFPRF